MNARAVWFLDTARSSSYPSSFSEASEGDAAREQEAKFNENQNIAQGHKKRNLASNIFSEQAPAENNRPAYDRKNISNVF